jgi:hypothetical protein
MRRSSDARIALRTCFARPGSSPSSGSFLASVRWFRLGGRVLRDIEARRGGCHGQPRSQARRGRVLPRLHAREGGGHRSRPRCDVPLGRRGIANAARDSGRGQRRSRGPTRRRLRRVRELPHPSRRRRDLALLGRHHGATEGRRAATPIVREHNRAVRQGRHGLHRERHHALGSQALLRLRHRLESHLPVLGGRHLDPLLGEVHPRSAVRADREAPAPRSSSTCPRWCIR